MSKKRADPLFSRSSALFKKSGRSFPAHSLSSKRAAALFAAHSLFKQERMSKSLIFKEQIAHSLIRLQKMSETLFLKEKKGSKFKFSYQFF